MTNCHMHWVGTPAHDDYAFIKEMTKAQHVHLSMKNECPEGCTVLADEDESGKE